MSLNIPIYNAYVKSDIAKFHEHEIQKYIALFLSKKELYDGIHQLGEDFKEDFFFSRFRRFLTKYYTIKNTDFDLNQYFQSQHLSGKRCSTFVGGGCSRSKSGRNVTDTNNSYAMTLEVIEYFKKKYGVSISGKTDERLFIGQNAIWKFASPELLKLIGWDWVTECEYNDETMTKPLPENLDIQLVPLKIRNKVSQMWKKNKSADTLKNNENVKIEKNDKLLLLSEPEKVDKWNGLVEDCITKLEALKKELEDEDW